MTPQDQRPGREPRDDGRQPDDGLGRALGLGLITGAADDDPSAIGAYAAAGARCLDLA